MKRGNRQQLSVVRKLIAYSLLLIGLLSVPCTLYPVPLAHAQFQGAPFDVVTEFAVKDNDAQPGDLMSSTDQGIIRSGSAYDVHLFGVVAANNPVIVFKTQSGNGKPISRSGVVEVNITTINGEIKEGDYITSSELPGKAMRSRRSGYVIGTALKAFSGQGATQVDYTPKHPTKDDPARKVSVGKIPVAIAIQYANLNSAGTGSFLDAMGGIFNNVNPPEKFSDAAKYTLAGLMVIGSFLFGFFVFARSMPKAVEAIGRNPLAQRAIQFSIVLHIIFTIITTLIGIVAAVIIIRL